MPIETETNEKPPAPAQADVMPGSEPFPGLPAHFPDSPSFSEWTGARLRGETTDSLSRWEGGQALRRRKRAVLPPKLAAHVQDLNNVIRWRTIARRSRPSWAWENHKPTGADLLAFAKDQFPEAMTYEGIERHCSELAGMGFRRVISMLSAIEEAFRWKVTGVYLAQSDERLRSQSLFELQNKAFRLIDEGAWAGMGATRFPFAIDNVVAFFQRRIIDIFEAASEAHEATPSAFDNLGDSPRLADRIPEIEAAPLRPAPISPTVPPPRRRRPSFPLLFSKNDDDDAARLAT